MGDDASITVFSRIERAQESVFAPTRLCAPHLVDIKGLFVHAAHKTHLAISIHSTGGRIKYFLAYGGAPRARGPLANCVRKLTPVFFSEVLHFV